MAMAQHTVLPLLLRRRNVVGNGPIKRTYVFAFLTMLLLCLQGETNQPTFCSHQSRGPAAAEAVQQRPGPDVVVEEGRGAAQLGQTQEQPQERGLVGEEQRHRVAFADAAALQERPGGLIAQLVRLLVREALVPVEHEGLVRLIPRELREAVRDEVVLPGVVPDQGLDLELQVHMVGILEQVRMAEEKGHQEEESGGEHEPQQHGGARGVGGGPRELGSVKKNEATVRF